MYRFQAQLIPDRHRLVLKFKMPFAVDWDLVEGRVTDSGVIDIDRTAVTVELSTTQKQVRLADLKLRVEELIEDVVNPHAYIKAMGWLVDVHTVVQPDGKTVQFALGAEEIANTEKDRPVSVEDVYKACELERRLPRVLRDLKFAMGSELETYFFLYRAIETIRGHFDDQFPVGRDQVKLGWTAMNSTLNLDESWSKSIAVFATPQRHGSRVPVLASERVDAMCRAWAVVDRFCVYVLRNRQPLPASDFPILKG